MTHNNGERWPYCRLHQWRTGGGIGSRLTPVCWGRVESVQCLGHLILQFLFPPENRPWRSCFSVYQLSSFPSLSLAMCHCLHCLQASATRLQLREAVKRRGTRIILLRSTDVNVCVYSNVSIWNHLPLLCCLWYVVTCWTRLYVDSSAEFLGHVFARTD